MLREQSVVQHADAVPELGGRSDRPECVVLADDGYSEDGEGPPGLHARDAAVPVDRRAHAFAVPVEERTEHLGLQPAGELAGVRDPCDDHRHRLARGPAGERGPHRSKARARPRRCAERGILPEDRPLELLELLARIDAEVLDEHPACVLVGGEGVRLSPRLVQGEHQERAQVLPVRMLACERLEPEDDIRVMPELDLEPGQLLARRELQLQEARHGRLRERLERKILERLPADASELASQPLRTVPRRQVVVEQSLEPHRVDLHWRDREDVPGRLGPNGLTPERAPQLRDVVLERMPRRPRRGLTPHVLHETIRSHRLAGAERQNGENGAKLPSLDREHPFSVPNLEGPEELEVQHGAFLHAPPRSNKVAARPARPHHAPVRRIPHLALAAAAIAGVLAVHVDRGVAVLPGENGKIAFAGARDGNFEIYVVDPDATGSARLTNDPATDTDPAWSPEGRRITFTTTRNGNDDIYLMSADGTGQVQLTSSPGRDSNSTWSPGGRNIAFVSTRDGDAEIFVMNEDGTGQSQLTSNDVPDATPAWSPDGTRIAFRSERDGNSEIYVMRVDGSDAVRLTDEPGLGREPELVSGRAVDRVREQS